MGLFFVERKKFPVILLDRVQQPVNFHPWIPAIVNGHSAAWIFDTAISFDSFSESSRIDKKKKQKNKKTKKNLRQLMIWKIDFLLFQVFQEEFHIVVDP